MPDMEVLLVDDQAVTIQVYAASVRKTFNGAKVHTAVDLPEALQIASGRALDLVLLDLSLPTCTGIEALYRFRTLVKQAYILAGSLTGGETAPDAPALDLLATILGGGRTSRLHRKLVEETALTDEVLAINFSLSKYPKISDRGKPSK